MHDVDLLIEPTRSTLGAALAGSLLAIGGLRVGMGRKRRAAVRA